MTTFTDPNPAEVEELLKAAQDDLLLNLSVNSHAISGRAPTLSLPPSLSPSSLDPDLSRRFDALQSQPAPAASARVPSHQGGGGGGGGAEGAVPGADAASAVSGDGSLGGRNEGEDEVSKILGDDLASRFAALKASSSSHLPAGHVARPPVLVAKGEVDDDDSEGSDDDVGGVSKKEVEKLMQWAMDAARLDPDPGSGEDGEGIGKEMEGDEEGDEEDESEQDEVAARAGEKGKEKKEEAEGKKPPSRKWFFFR